MPREANQPEQPREGERAKVGVAQDDAVVVVLELVRAERREVAHATDEEDDARAAPERKPEPAPTSCAAFFDGLHLIWRHAYVFNLLLISTLYEVVLTVLDFEMKVVGRARYGLDVRGAEDFARLMGQFGARRRPRGVAATSRGGRRGTGRGDVAEGRPGDAAATSRWNRGDVAWGDAATSRDGRGDVAATPRDGRGDVQTRDNNGRRGAAARSPIPFGAARAPDVEGARAGCGAEDQA